MSDKSYKRENRALRDAARTVAHVRDADVMVEAIDGLHERFADDLSADIFRELRGRLEQDAEQSRANGVGEVGADLATAAVPNCSETPCPTCDVRGA